MTSLLAIDCSTPLCSLTLVHHDTIVHASENGSKNHESMLLRHVTDLLSKARISCHDLQGIIYGAGPGGFTGIRLAAGFATGLAMGLHIYRYPSITLRAMCFAHPCDQERIVCSALDARMGQTYIAMYHQQPNGHCDILMPPMVAHPDQIPWPQIDPNLPCWAVGNALEIYDSLKNSRSWDVIDQSVVPSAWMHIQSHTKMPIKPITDSWAAPNLTYVRNNVATKKKPKTPNQ